MVSMFLRKGIALASVCTASPLLKTLNMWSKAFTTIPSEENEVVTRFTSASHYPSNIHLSPFFSDGNNHAKCFDIELLDHDAWRISSGVAQACRGTDLAASEAVSLSHEAVDEPFDSYTSEVDGEFDFEDLDNMRIRGNLFYKLERNSREYEEYNVEFHRRKAPKRKNDRKENIKEENKAKTSPKLTTKAEKAPKVHQVMGSKGVATGFDIINDTSLGSKRQRTPTFNQLTGPYHEPFCLDIYISKASVRACIVHRVTSKVVVVAHSISKDMKFDLTSTKNKAACAAVGAILGQRALDDDIYDVIYTPRKGERLEGKLQIVLQSIIDSGINVKVKIKQRIPKKALQTHVTHYRS